MSRGSPAAKRAALSEALRGLALRFADDMLALLDQHGAWDQHIGDAGATSAPTPQRARRSAQALSQLMAEIVTALQEHEQAVAVSEVAASMHLTSRQLTYPLGRLVADGKVLRSGTRRGARYRLKATPDSDRKRR